jgi:hypothetical protein
MTRSLTNLFILLSLVSLSFTQDLTFTADGAYVSLDSNFQVGLIDVDELGYPLKAVVATDGIVIDVTVTDFEDPEESDSTIDLKIGLVDGENIENIYWGEIEIVDLSQAPENIENFEIIDYILPIDESENNEDDEPVEPVQSVNSTQPSEPVQPVQSTESVAPAETVETINHNEIMESSASNSDPNFIEYPDGLLVVNQEDFTIVDYRNDGPAGHDEDSDSLEETDATRPTATIEEKGFLGKN